MKNLTKLFTMALALIVALSLATTAFAATIIVNDKDIENAEYGAYKLLNVTDLGNGKFNYTVNPTYRDALLAAINSDEELTDEQIINYIAALTSDTIQDFADAVFEQVKTMDPDEETTTNQFTDVDQGYYLIVETETGSAEGFDEDTYSLVMLDTAGQDVITVNTKEELPESEKKVKDANDTTGDKSDWQDSADHDIEDEVSFQITFKLPGKFDAYETYYVGVHDVQAKGLTYNDDLVVTVNGTDLTDYFDYSAVAEGACDKGCTFHIQCDDIISAATAEGITLKAGDVIYFNYTSTLNEDAEFGATGNPNEMTIEFSNNPYGDGTSFTPWDRVIVFTFRVDVDKYTTIDGTKTNLPGAGFTLYKEVADANTDGAKTGAEIKAELAQQNAAIKASALKDEAYYVIAATVEVDADGDTFSFKGVDDGNYVLVETLIPVGYNAWNAEEFTISAEHDIEHDDPQLTELTGGNLLTGEVSTGILHGEIENKSGIELPETGGIGTTIFYIVGGLLAVAAVVLLVTKKRMATAE